MADEETRDERRPDPASEPGRSGLSRRSFLSGTAAGGLASLLAGRSQAQGDDAPGDARRTEHGTEILGPGRVVITLEVNGEARELEVEPRTTLLDALRQELGLTGAKRVCDRGTCGACTVLVDGDPAYACSLLAVASQGAAIETVESLGEPDDLHPLQAAFIDHDAQQCGFCTPGFVVAAKALLDRNPNPSDAEVLESLSGNFCRCGTYAGLKKAVPAAAKGGGNG